MPIDPGAWKEIIVTAITTAGAIIGGQKGVKAIWGSSAERQGKQIISDVADLMTRREWHAEMDQYLTRDSHDRECMLKMHPVEETLRDMKDDIRELLRRNGGPRT